MTQGFFKFFEGGGLSSFCDLIAPEIRCMLFSKAMISLWFLVRFSTTFVADLGTFLTVLLFFLLPIMIKRKGEKSSRREKVENKEEERKRRKKDG